jgi:hypothetical protein
MSAETRHPFEQVTGCPASDAIRHENSSRRDILFATRRGSIAAANAIIENCGVSRNTNSRALAGASMSFVAMPCGSPFRPSVSGAILSPSFS